MSETASDAEHPVRLIVTDDLVRSRLTVFFRYFLVIPHVIVAELWGIVLAFALLFAWLAALATGRVPEGLHSFIASYVNYTTHLFAYALLIANPYPPFSGTAPYPVDVAIAGPQAQSRITVFFRLPLAIPAAFLASVFRSVNGVIALLGWFYALATGRMNGGMRDLSAWLLRYEVQTYAYMLLLTSRYPSLAGAPTV